jgi:hypothetical protein
MGIRFYCPNGHKLNVKEFQAGQRGVCPYCGTKFLIPSQSTRKSSKEERAARRALTAASSPTISPDAQNPAFAVSSDLSAGEALPVRQIPSPLSPLEDPSSAVGFTTFSLNNPLLALTQLQPDDAIAEAGDVVWYVRPPSSGQYGPATAMLMRQWLGEGRIGPDSLVWREGWRDWRQASEVFPQLRANAPIADINSNDNLSVQPLFSPDTQQAMPQTPKYMLKLTITLIVLGVLIITGLVIWAFTRTDKVKSRSLSTATEIRDTLNPYGFL